MKKLYLLLSILFILGIGIAKAQYTVLHNFNSATGSYPSGSVTLAGNKLFGMTQEGGLYNYGCIYSLDTNGSDYKILVNFNDTNGSNPQNSFIISGNKLIGMTSGASTIFIMDTNGTGFKTFYKLSGTNGYWPFGKLSPIGNKLYGMAEEGGRYGFGTIFSIDTNGTGFKNLHSFNDTSGSTPRCLNLTISGGKLFGMAMNGGVYDSGCIFSIDTNGMNYKDIFDFNGTNGKGPFGNSLILSGSVLYGIVTDGGLHDRGCIFAIDTDGSGYIDLHDFNGANGRNPESALSISYNTLYGTTFIGGANGDGCMFSIATNGLGYTDMFDFNGSDGVSPWNMQLTLSNSIIYGSTSYGGINNAGTIFSFKDIGLGINNSSIISNPITLYPNPSTGIFTISFAGQQNHAPATIEIYNVLGEKVYSQFSIIHSQLSINLTCQPNGIYLYRVIAQDGSLLGEGKVVIQK